MDQQDEKKACTCGEQGTALCECGEDCGCAKGCDCGCGGGVEPAPAERPGGTVGASRPE